MEEKSFLKVKCYPNLKITDSSHLLTHSGRFKCEKCKKSRKFFCYSCGEPREKSLTPHVKIPIEIDIIKHKQELVGKSTSSHAKILAPDRVNIYQYPDIPDYTKEEDIILIFVSTTKIIDVKALFQGKRQYNMKSNYGLSRGRNIGTLLKRKLDDIIDEDNQTESELEEFSNTVYTLENLPIKKAVFIDSTWKQCRSIYKDPRISALDCCIIQNRLTKFWRSQKDSPNWYLATIEAIHQFLMEFHIYAFGIEKNYFDNCLSDFKLISTDWIPKQKIIESAKDCNADQRTAPYNGQYDDILYYFSFIYALIHSLESPSQRLPKIV